MISGAEAIGDGGAAILSTGTIFAAPQLPQGSAGHQVMAPSMGMLVPPTPSGSAGAPPPVPVRIDVQF
ncbi:MAG: hypothetical protein MPW14_19150 [Candidatus Manganitrophus sp.]|nr:MAG: hypothetical protein MPW14_19150 [Candidatus Manganitrophus sp.]